MPASVFKENFRSFISLGYSPLARFESSWPKAWSDYCLAVAPDETLRRWKRAPNAMIALACGFRGLVALDYDSDDPVIKAEILKALPQCRVARFGSKGFALLARYVGEKECRFTNIYTGEGAQKRALVEIKGTGQNITVPPSIHAKTGATYYWMNPETGECTEARPAFDELPAIDDANIERLRAALARWASPPRPAAPRRPGFDPAKIAKSRYEAWFRAGLTNAQSELSGLREGRPTALFKSVCALGAGVHHQFIQQREFESAYLAACDANGLSSREGHHAILATIYSGLRWSADDDLPDLGEQPARQKAAKRQDNGGGQADHTICHDTGKATREHSGNGLDRDAAAEDPRPVINIHEDLNIVVDKAEEALFEAKAEIYQQGGVLVWPKRCSLIDNKGDKVHVPAIAAVNAVIIRDALSRHARWHKWDGRGKKFVRTNPPQDIAQTVFSRQGQGECWRILAGVSASPMLRRDGTILAKKGYDEMSGWFLQDLPSMPSMPPHPSEGDARKALETLKPLLEEFPFIDSLHSDRKPENTASYSVAMSAILTLPARPMMNVAPGHAARANEAGTGKTYLFNIASAIGLGTKCPVITQGEDKTENEKRLGALMFSGSQIICIDNVNGDLQSDLLGQIISEDLVQARVLGKSESPKLSNRFLVFVTGNNLQIVGDLNRRMLICEMDAVLEHPYQRRFDHDPVAMVFQDRGRYIAACLTIIRAHYLAGCPGSADLDSLVTFEQWTNVVRGALVWLGLRDPVESMEVLKKADPMRVEQSAFVTAMAELFEPDYAKPVTVSEIIEEASRMEEDGRNDARKRLKDMLKEFSDRHGNPSSRRVGKWLGRFLTRRFGDFRLVGTNEKRPMMEYWVERLP